MPALKRLAVGLMMHIEEENMHKIQRACILVIFGVANHRGPESHRGTKAHLRGGRLPSSSSSFCCGSSPTALAVIREAPAKEHRGAKSTVKSGKLNSPVM